MDIRERFIKRFIKQMQNDGQGDLINIDYMAAWIWENKNWLQEEFDKEYDITEYLFDVCDGNYEWSSLSKVVDKVKECNDER